MDSITRGFLLLFEGLGIDEAFNMEEDDYSRAVIKYGGCGSDFDREVKLLHVFETDDDVDGVLDKILSGEDLDLDESFLLFNNLRNKETLESLDYIIEDLLSKKNIYSKDRIWVDILDDYKSKIESIPAGEKEEFLKKVGSLAAKRSFIAKFKKLVMLELENVSNKLGIELKVEVAGNKVNIYSEGPLYKFIAGSKKIAERWLKGSIDSLELTGGLYDSYDDLVKSEGLESIINFSIYYSYKLVAPAKGYLYYSKKILNNVVGELLN